MVRATAAGIPGPRGPASTNRAERGQCRPGADLRYESIKSFASVLDSAGWEFLAEWGEIPAEVFRLRVEECPSADQDLPG
jgi:hypothetical protein